MKSGKVTKFVCLYEMIIFQGLLEVFKEFMPNANHRFCVRHMHANFKSNGDI